jgi:hypothetical protein
MVSETKRVTAEPIPLSRMQVSISTEYEQYPASETSHQGSYVSVAEQLGDKPSGLSLRDDPESGAER